MYTKISFLLYQFTGNTAEPLFCLWHTTVATDFNQQRRKLSFFRNLNFVGTIFFRRNELGFFYQILHECGKVRCQSDNLIVFDIYIGNAWFAFRAAYTIIQQDQVKPCRRAIANIHTVIRILPALFEKFIAC